MKNTNRPRKKKCPPFPELTKVVHARGSSANLSSILIGTGVESRRWSNVFLRFSPIIPIPVATWEESEEPRRYTFIGAAAAPVGVGV